MIFDAKNVKIGAVPSTLPNMSDTLTSWFQNVTFIRITKSVVDFQVKEVQTPECFYGVRQPFSPQQLQMKPEGQRMWKWETIHATPALILIPDEIIKFENTKYRVSSKTDWKEYGYVEYHIVEDYKT